MALAPSLLRTHVAGGADKCSDLCKYGFSERGSCSQFCQAEIDDARHGLAVDFDYQDVRGFQIAMNDGFLMGMLHAFTDADEESKAFRNAEFLSIAVLGDGSALDILHDEVGLTIWCGAGIENFRN